jgi:hypothetical protein
VKVRPCNPVRLARLQSWVCSGARCLLLRAALGMTVEGVKTRVCASTRPALAALILEGDHESPRNLRVGAPKARFDLDLRRHLPDDVGCERPQDATVSATVRKWSPVK